MPISVRALIDLSRDVLQDMDPSNLRYSDASMIRALNMAVLDLRRDRPDYFIGTFDTMIPPVSGVTDTLDLPQELMPAFSKYVAGWVEMRDDEYTADGRAASLLGSYKSDIGRV